jgi:uncharacterized damage-inducible protein DinB
MWSNDDLKILENEIQKETRRRILEEFIPRILKCLSLLSEEDVWFRPNKESNSIGNLVLHVEGNARQWIISGLGGAKDERNRKIEFEEKGPLPKIQLIEKLNLLYRDIEFILNKIDLKNLITVRRVQVFDETGLAILIHAIEHFSYHTGQIAYATKMITNSQLGFYADLNL